MPPAAIRRILGPLPLFRGLFRWSLAVLFTTASWHVYLLAPIPGLIAIGLSPVVTIFLFFRGLNLVSRTFSYWKTSRSIQKLGMTPTWWDTKAGYLVIDELRGLWVIDGKAGTIPELSRLHGHSDWQGHRLELYAGETEHPTACYGFGSAGELRSVVALFQKAGASPEGCPLPVTYEDRREPEQAGNGGN